MVQRKVSKRLASRSALTDTWRFRSTAYLKQDLQKISWCAHDAFRAKSPYCYNDHNVSGAYLIALAVSVCDMQYVSNNLIIS